MTKSIKALGGSLLPKFASIFGCVVQLVLYRQSKTHRRAAL